MSRRQSHRRDFLKTSAGIATAVPYVWTSAYTRAQSANDKPGVACIGVGGQGSNIGRSACRGGRLVAVCDVDESHAKRFIGRTDSSDVKVYKDYRKLLENEKGVDIVTIGTPDHWHVAVAIAALKAGKDIYCEKPLTLTIDEGKKICRVVKETKRVFQVGTQQRSDRRFLMAIAIARSGRLGKTLTATCSLGAGPSSEPFPTSDPPAELDWDLWLGQAPKVAYCRQRCHGSFRWWLEYSGGKLTDWGAHHVDIAQWGLGFENSGPVEIEGEGQFPNIPADFKPVEFFAGRQTIPNGYNTATTFKITLKFANGSQIIVQHGPDNGIWFEGDKGKIFVNRGRITGQPVEDLSQEDRDRLINEDVVKLYKGKQVTGHMQNFFECVKDRSDPVSDVYTHHRELSSCHLCNLAMLLRRKLKWDPTKEEFIGDDEANALLSRPRRAGFELDT